MKIFKLIPALFLSIFSLASHAQTEIPKGFKKGNITLTNGSLLSGSIKENIRGNSSIIFITEAGGKKKSYEGTELLSAEIGGAKFLCLKGDFFRVISEGDLSFLQKSGDASGKPSYNGNEAVFSNGTEGKPGDYYIYDKRNKQLKLVSRKNFTEVTAAAFAGNAEAMDKAKTANNDLVQLKEAVEIYNSHGN